MSQGTPTATKPLPPPPARGMGPGPVRRPAPAAPDPEPLHEEEIQKGQARGPQRIQVYGPGGIGKSTLASLAPPPIFLDLEDGTRELDVHRVHVASWAELRRWLQSDKLLGYQTVVIDTITRAEEFCIAHTLATVPHEKGHRCDNIEAYGFGKGYSHVYDQFLPLLADCDAVIRSGRNVILVCHDCTADVPNPVGEDFLRFEPHLQAPKSGKASIRERVFQWADHVLFLGYDIVAKDGKGVGGGTRTIWPIELPSHRAKSRMLDEPLAYEGPQDGRFWELIFRPPSGS